MTMDATRLAVALSHANVGAILRVLREGESNQNDDAYTLINGGAHFASFAAHPFGELPTTRGGRASGAYQFLPTTWADLCRRYPWALPDFSPRSQDAGAVLLVHDRGALDDVMAGRIETAIAKLRPTWTSLPGASENSGRYTMARALDVYRRHGGRLAAGESDTQPAAPIEGRSTIYVPPKETIMPFPLLALFTAFAPVIAEMIPQVSKLFKPDVPKEDRNWGAIQLVLDTIVKATGTTNVQSAVEAMKADPAAKAAATVAVVTEPDIMAVLEIGGGIIAARQANAAAIAAAVPIWKNPAFLITLLVLPLVYLVTLGVLLGNDSPESYWRGFWGKEFMPETRSATVNLILGMVLGGIMGFFFGTTFGSARKTDLLAEHKP